MREVICQVASILFSVSQDATGKEILLKNARIFSKETEQQTADKEVQVVQVIIATELVSET